MNNAATSGLIKQITDLNSLVVAGSEGSRRFGGCTLWWRGQADFSWSLLPGIYRCVDWGVRETNLAVRFRQKAKVRHAKCPNYDDFASWLFLMQHYKLPTRLLDWTESALVALYFVVADSTKHDRPGFLWGLSPTRLNRVEFDEQVYYGSTNIKVRPLFGQAFAGKQNDEKGYEKIAAVITDHQDIRQMIQASAFTVHGVNTSLSEHRLSDNFLIRYEVPAVAKKSLLAILTNIGITRSYLFPDLENLSKDLMSQSFKV